MMNRAEKNNFYREILQAAEEENCLQKVTRELCKTDLFFLGSKILNIPFIESDFAFERCNEVQANPDGYLDLWARGHGKTCIITQLKTIQDVLINPEVTIGIFSHNLKASKSVLLQIKRDFERHELYKLFPDILYEKPVYEAPKWNEEGLIVKRKSNPKEATVEAFGLVDGQPTGRHFTICVYDDVITQDEVHTPEQIVKATNAWELSLNLIAKNGQRRYAGTRYHFDDTWATIIERKAAIPRLHPAMDEEGRPVLFTMEELEDRRKSMSPYQFSCQMMLDPKDDERTGFKQEWLVHYQLNDDFRKWNIYIIVDPANTKNKRSDYTAMLVIGVGDDENYYIIDMVRDRLNLDERIRVLMQLVRDYRPICVYYEEYGMQSDINAIKMRMQEEQYRFKITAVKGKLKKADRINRLIPLFKDGKIWLPERLMRTNIEGKEQDLTRIFTVEEYLTYPYCKHEDCLDGLSRICDKEVNMVPPSKDFRRRKIKVKTEYNPFKKKTLNHSWM